MVFWPIYSIFLPCHGPPPGPQGIRHRLTMGLPEGGELAVDVLGLVDSVVDTYGAPIVGATLILGGIFLRLLGKGIAYLILGVGIAGTVYVAIRELGTNDMRLVGAVFAAGIVASVSLALALRAITVAFEFGFFTTGWYLLLPTFVPTSGFLPSPTGATTWAGLAIGTTILAELFMRRLRRSGRFPVPAVAAVASTVRGVRP